MILTGSFDLKTMTVSATATAKGYSEQFTPPASVVSNLTDLYTYVLHPLVSYLEGEINVTCAYRCPRVNSDVGGKDTSQHPTGHAADVEYRVKGVERNDLLVQAIKDLDLDFDQCIIENGKNGWVHISYRKGKNRKQFLSLTV